jgi:hypothetical protein
MDSFDVIVAGGGPAGIMAALAAARLGSRVLLIEKNGFLGGTATASLIGPISPFHFKDEQVIKGIPQDFVDGMVRLGGSTGHMKALNPYGSGDSMCYYDREKYKYAAAEMLLKAGVTILYHSFISGVVKEKNRIIAVKTMSKAGEHSYPASVFVDATGDGDLAVLAGAEYVMGEEPTGKMQPSSSMFEMANVDIDALFDYIYSNPEEFEFASDMVPLREFSPRLEQHYFVVQGFLSLVKKGMSDGRLTFGRDSLLLLNGVYPGTVHFNSTRIIGKDPTKVEGRTEGEIEGRRQIESVSEFAIKYLPGFSKAFVSVTCAEIGVRESRHITGLYTLTGDDVVEGRKFDDVASRGYFPIDIHSRDGAAGYTESGQGGVWKVPKDSYDIPCRCLVPKEIDGLVLSGRCISGTSEAHGSYRTQGGIMGIGQASGAAAALCALRKVQPRHLDYHELQKALVGLGASVFRDEEAKKKEEDAARKAVAGYIKKYPRLISPGFR